MRKRPTHSCQCTYPCSPRSRGQLELLRYSWENLQHSVEAELSCPDRYIAEMRPERVTHHSLASIPQCTSTSMGEEAHRELWHGAGMDFRGDGRRITEGPLPGSKQDLGLGHACCLFRPLCWDPFVQTLLLGSSSMELGQDAQAEPQTAASAR